MTDISAGRPYSWLRALNNQANVVGALLMRELHTRYGRDNVGYLWLILEPMTLATAVALIHWQSPGHTTSDISAVALSTLGYCVFIMFRGIFTRSEGAIEANTPLLYHRQVTVFDMLLARAALEFVGTSATLFVLLGIGIALGLANFPERPEYLLGALVLMAWWSFALSMLCCAGTHDNKLVARFVHPISYIMMPLSGAFFMAQWVPQPYRDYFLMFPMVHIFEIARYGQFRSASPRNFDLPYLIGWCMILTCLGLLSLRIVRRHIHLH